MMKVPSILVKLARLFPTSSPLYLVGGAVRDGLIGIESSDYDIAASLTSDAVKTILIDSPFKICGEFPRTGTLIIAAQGFKCEYTTFRSDSYPPGSGIHAPAEITFTGDINIDAMRRDFTCNAVYYDIVGHSYIDPTMGMADIAAKVIRTTRTPQAVLSEDALRIMRLPRLATELGFHVEPDTLRAASDYAAQLQDIAPERIQTELVKILTAKDKYPDFCGGFKPSYGISLLNDLGVSQIIFGSAVPFDTLLQMDNLATDGYYAATTATYLALLLLPLDGGGKEFLAGLKFSKEMTHDVTSIIDGCRDAEVLTKANSSTATAAIVTSIIDGCHDAELKSSSEKDSVVTRKADIYRSTKFFVAKYIKYIRHIVNVLMSSGKDCTELIECIHIITNLGIPTRQSELMISGKYLVDSGITGEVIGDILDALLLDCIDQELTTKEEQINHTQTLIAKFVGRNL